VSIPFPTADTVFSFLDKIGRRHLLEDEEAAAPAPAMAGPAPAPMTAQPGQPGPIFQALPNLNLDSQTADDSTNSAPMWFQTVEGNMPPGTQQAQAQPQPVQLQSLPQPQPQTNPQPVQLQALPLPHPGNMQLEAAPEAPMPQPAGLPEQAPAAQPEPLARAPTMAEAPGIALGPVPSDVKAFTSKLSNFLSYAVRQNMPKRIEILPGAGRRLRQEDDSEDAPLPLLPEPFAAEAPMAAPGVCHCVF
jgi:hypothetical protein